MSQPSNQEIKSAKAIVGRLPEPPELEDPYWNHEHDGNCMEIETVEVTSFVTPDIDNSYEREIYVCKVTGEDIDLDFADPAVDRAEALEDMEQDRDE